MASKSKGRQKIEMKRMSKESNLLVTFSKRRSGLFKKASELCTLCGAEIAIVVFSPGKKAFSFGHPSVEAIADRFVYKSSVHGSSSSATSQLVEAHRNASVRELNLQLTEAMNQLEVEKKRGEDLNNIKKPNQERCWWEAPVDELSIEHLQQLKVAMEDLKKNVTKQAEKLRMLEPPNLHYANSSATSFYTAAGVDPSNPMNGLVGPMPDVKFPGLGLSMTPHGHAHGYGLGYGYGHGHGRGFF